jgi:hypothetical protein
MSTSSTGSSFGGGSSSSQSGSHDYGKTYEPGTGASQSGSGLSGSGSTGVSQKEKHSEGTVAKTIEQQTAKLPSDVFLWAALGSMGVSAALHFSGAKDQSRFVGQWVAPLLLFGVYNKIVKTQGSDRTER